MKRSDKRGSHVGMILSFLVFVTFLSFLFVILYPAISVQRDKEALLDFLEIELLEQISGELTIFSIKLETELSGNCFEIDISEIDGLDQTKKHFVRGAIHSYIRPDKLIIYPEDTSKTFYEIVFSDDEFLESYTGRPSRCTSIYSSEYQITSPIKTREYVFEKTIEDIESYESLRDTFDFPEGSEFNFKLDDGVEIGGNYSNVPTSIFSNDILVQYIDEEANIKSGVVNIKVW